MFYDNLASACAQKNTKIATIVKECGGAAGSIDGWKKGAIPRSDIVAEIALRLNVTTDYLLLGRTPTPSIENNISADEQTLLSFFNSLNDEGKEKALERLEEMASLDRYKKGDKYNVAKEA